MTYPSSSKQHPYAHHTYYPQSHQRQQLASPYHHHQNNDSSETVFSTPLLGTPPPLPTPMHAHRQLSPSSPSSITLAPISPPTTAPKKLKTIAELNSVKGEKDNWRPGITLPPIETLCDERSRLLAPPNPSQQHWRPSPNIAAQMELRGPPDEDDEQRMRSSPSTRPTTSLSASTSLASVPSVSPRTPYTSSSELGRPWWPHPVSIATNTPSTSATPLPRRSPAIAVSPPEDGVKKYLAPEDEEVDELASERSYSVERSAPASTNPFDYRNWEFKQTHRRGQASYPSRDLSAYHLTPPATADAYQLRPLSNNASNTNHLGHRRASTYSPAVRPQPRLPPLSPSAFSTTSLPTPVLQTQPLNSSSTTTRKPIYNRSKQDGTHHCGYLPPLSTDPMAVDPSPPQPCGTTACKKADLDRHFDEIHAKEEAGRVFRRELDVGCAARFLVDLANMVLKELKSDGVGGTGKTTINLWDGPSKVVENRELWIQADRVRTRVGKELAREHAAAAMVNYRFDFVANGCADFQDLANARAHGHRAYPCAGCVKSFGSQRSLERHYNMTACGAARPDKKAGGAAGKKRKGRSSEETGEKELLASPFIEHRFEGGRAVVTTDSPPATKRPRISSPLKTVSAPAVPQHQSSSVMMRVRQQTPETRMPQAGYHAMGDEQLRRGDVKMEVDADEQLYEEEDHP